MSRPVHRPCPWRLRRKCAGETRDYCTVQTGDHPPDAPFCRYCADGRGPVKRIWKPKGKDKA